jgi:hypothetical protein
METWKVREIARGGDFESERERRTRRGTEARSKYKKQEGGRHVARLYKRIIPKIRRGVIC